MAMLTLKVGGEIEYDSHVRIKHKDTGTWLHLNKGVLLHTIIVVQDCYNKDDIA